MKKRISWHEYNAIWRKIHDRVFSGNDVDDNPFRDTTWKLVLLTGGLAMDPEDCEGVARVAVRVGDTEAVVADPHEKFPNEEPILVGWESRSFENLYSGSVYGHIEAHVFGQSGRWGLVTSEETFAVFGSEKILMDKFLADAGGEKRVRERFLRSAKAGDIGFGDQGERFVERLLKMVGWNDISMTD